MYIGGGVSNMLMFYDKFALMLLDCSRIHSFNSFKYAFACALNIRSDRPGCSVSITSSYRLVGSVVMLDHRSAAKFIVCGDGWPNSKPEQLQYFKKDRLLSHFR